MTSTGPAGWSATTSATYPATQSGQFLGSSVALSAGGTTALIGAPAGQNGGATPPAAYLATSSAGVWPSQPQVTFTGAADAFANLGLGQSVALSGDGRTALVGAPSAGSGGSDQGAAYLYTAAPTWSTTPALTFPPQSVRQFGRSAALSADGGVALIGANADAGAAYVFGAAATAPTVPTAVTGQAGDRSATVSWSAPASDGGSPITGYTVTANDVTTPAHGGQTVTGSSGPLTVQGLTGGDAYTFTVTATNAAGTSAASQPSTLLVAQQSPAFTSPATAGTGMRVPFSDTLTTTGTPTAAISESGPLPAGITLTDNGDGTAALAGAAAVGSAGSYPITLTATNGVGQPATQAFVLTITTASSAPSISSASADTETFGMPYTFAVTTTGYPSPKITRTGNLPAGVTFADNGNGTATFTGTPTRSAVGVYPHTLTARSSTGTATQSFTLTITKAPVINKIPNTTAHVGSPVQVPITVSGYTTPTITESGPLPAGVSLADHHNGTAAITGVPATGSGGAYAITITATNPLGTASQTFTLKVNEAPAITSPATANAHVGTAFSFTVTASGYPAPWIGASGQLPAGVTFKFATATFSGTPKATARGTYSVAITASNGTAVTRTLTLSVT